MMPQGPTREELDKKLISDQVETKEREEKSSSENNQQAAPAPLTLRQLGRGNNTRIPVTDHWEEITSGFDLKELISFGQVSRFFNRLFQSPEVREQMRAFASLLPRFTPLQKSYLNAERTVNRIERNQLTLSSAVAGIAPNRLPTQSTVYGAVNVSTKNTAVGLGVSPAEMQDDWFSDAHVEALQAGIPFEEIERLTTYQVQAMLATRNLDNVRPLTRKDVISSNLGAGHIEALKKGVSFESIKKLSVVHLKALSVGFTEDDIRQLNTVQVNMLLHGLSVKGVTAPAFLQWFEKIKYHSNSEYLINQLLGKGYTPGQIIELNTDQLEALGNSHGDDSFTLEQVTNSIFVKLCQDNKKDDGGYEIRSSIRGALRAGYSLEDIAGLNFWQLKALNKGDNIEQVKNPDFGKLSEFGGQCRWGIDKLLKQGVEPKEIAALTRLQLRALDSDDGALTLEKVRHPRFSESAHHAIVIAGYDFEAVIDLEPWQHRLLIAGVSLEEVREPNPNITLKHVMAVQAGGNYQDIKSLNYAALDHYLAMPCSVFLQAQQPLPSRVSRVSDSSGCFSPVVLHEAYSRGVARSSSSCSSSSSSASGSYYPSSSSNSSSAGSAYYPSSSSNSSSASTPAADSTLSQYQLTARRSSSLEAEERRYPSDGENKTARRSPSPERPS